jgi:hypothetical protein
VRAVADGGDGRLGGADQAHDLAVLELRVIAQQPQDRIGPVLAARDGGVAWAGFGLDLGDVDFGVGELEPVTMILLRALDFLARELPAGNGVHAFDAVSYVAVGDALHLQHVQAAKFGDLLKSQRRVLY